MTGFELGTSGVEATTLPTEPQPLPSNLFLKSFFSFHNTSIVQLIFLFLGYRNHFTCQPSLLSSLRLYLSSYLCSYYFLFIPFLFGLPSIKVVYLKKLSLLGFSLSLSVKYFIFICMTVFFAFL